MTLFLVGPALESNPRPFTATTAMSLTTAPTGCFSMIITYQMAEYETQNISSRCFNGIDSSGCSLSTFIKDKVNFLTVLFDFLRGKNRF